MIEHYPFPCEAPLAELEQLPPFAPFNTTNHARALAALGEEPHIFLVRAGHGAAAGCVGKLTRGRFSSRLEIPSFPQLQDPREFGQALLEFCKANSVWDLELGTFGSTAATLPEIATEVSRRRRWEFALDLTQQKPLQGISSNHRRNAQRAVKNGVTFVARQGSEAVPVHLQLMNTSMSRRQARGEDVSTSHDTRRIDSLLANGAAEMFQAVKDGTVLSSVLVLLSARCGYYHSAGTSSEGMELGASSFLIGRIAEELRARGLIEFNLGGAEPDNPGLYRFKTGFGGISRTLQAASFVCVSPLKRKLRSAARTARENPLALFSSCVTLEGFAAYATDPRTIALPEIPQGLEMRALTDQELTDLASDSDFGFSARKFATLGVNRAYGIRVDGRLAHIAWMIDCELDRRQQIRNVKLAPGEVEITHCVTAQEFRGRGLYPLAIALLCAQAASAGVSRIVMITGSDNTASRRGIEKAGLKPSGSVLHLFAKSRPSIGLTWRGHRTPFRPSHGRAPDPDRG